SGPTFDPSESNRLPLSVLWRRHSTTFGLVADDISSSSIVTLHLNREVTVRRHVGWEAFAFGFGPRGWGARRRRQWFEAGDMKYVIRSEERRVGEERGRRSMTAS